MRSRDFTNFVSSLAMLYLLWGLYTICSLTSYLMLCVMAIYHLHCHRQESGSDYISENFNMDRLYEERPEFFIKLTETLKLLNLDRQIIHPLHNDAAIPSACATAAHNSERHVSNLTSMSEGACQQLQRSPRNNAIDLEASTTYQGDKEVSTDHPHIESEHNQNHLSFSDLEEDSEAHSHTGHAGSTSTAPRNVPKIVISADKTLAAETKSNDSDLEEDSDALSDSGHAAAAVDAAEPKRDMVADTENLVNTGVDDEAMASEGKKETASNTVISVDKVLPTETKANGSDLEEDSDALSHSGHAAAAVDAAEPKRDMVADTENLVNTGVDDEAMASEGKKETASNTVISVDKVLPTETKANGSGLEEDSDALSHSGHAAAAEPKRDMVADTENLVDTGNTETIPSSNITATKPEGDDGTISQTASDANNNAMECSVEKAILSEDSDNQTLVNMEDMASVRTEEKDREVSLSRSNSPSNLRREEDSKGQLTENTAINEPAAAANLCLPTENNHESGPHHVECHKPCGSFESKRQHGNQEQGSSTCIFSPTDDPEKLQNNSPLATFCGLDLSSTPPLEGRQDKTAERLVKPSSTSIDLKHEHGRCSDEDNGRLNPEKQMTTQVLNSENNHSSDSDETTQSDPKAQHGRQPDQDTGCVNGLPPPSHETSAELQATKVKDQKKQRVMVDDVKEEDVPPDGRPAVKEKTQSTEEAVKDIQQTYGQSVVMEFSMSPGVHQKRNEPIAIQPERSPTESFSDSENESKGDHSMNVP